MEHDVIVRPGGDFSEVIFAYRGIKGLKVTDGGDLEVSLNEGRLIAQKPIIYQGIKGERVAVEGAYRLLKDEDGVFTYGFTVASYDHSKDLVIDPVLEYSTYLGGSALDLSTGIAVDSAGAAYVTGTTFSTDFPLMSPLQGACGGSLCTDAFIAKISDVPLPAVTLVITPDAVSVAQGTTLGYSVTATNTTASQQCFNYWEDTTLPDGSTFPPTGALFGPVRLCLNAGASQTAHLTHGVPIFAPLGSYIFNAFTGAFPIIVVAEAHFNFDVTPVGPMTNQPATSWRLLENGVRK